MVLKRKATVIVRIRTKGGDPEAIRMETKQKQWNGKTDSQSEYFKIRMAGASHDEAVSQLTNQGPEQGSRVITQERDIDAETDLINDIEEELGHERSDV